jgi:hypothetical protein
MKQLGKLRLLVSILFGIGMTGLVIGLKRCQHEEVLTSGVTPISAELDIPFSRYEVDASADTTLYTQTGTSLSVERGTFFTKSGKPVQGKVEVKVREFHDAAAILRSGIPMRLRSDKNSFLQSAGMLEIRAYQGDQELEIGGGKSIGAGLAAYRSSDKHQLYFLKDNESWETVDTFRTQPNTRKQHRIAELLRLKKKDKKEVVYQDIIFELYGDRDVAPELEPWRGQKWKIAKQHVTPAVLEAMRINWDSIKVIKVDEGRLLYKLAFWKKMYQPGDAPDLIKEFSVVVSPSTEEGSSEDIAAIMKDRFLKADTVQMEIEDEIARLKREADLVNTFKINRMGIWNIDRAAKLTDFVPVTARFDFQDQLKDFQKVRLFCIMKEDNSVVDFSNWKNDPLYLSAERPMEIVAVLPGGQLALVDFDQIKAKVGARPESVMFTTRKKPQAEYFAGGGGL